MEDMQNTPKKEAHDKDNNTMGLSMQNEIDVLKKQLQAQQKTTKNAIKFSIVVGLFSFFFVALNFSILFTVAGGVAGSERKIQPLQSQVLKLQDAVTKLEDSMQSQ